MYSASRGAITAWWSLVKRESATVAKHTRMAWSRLEPLLGPRVVLVCLVCVFVHIIHTQARSGPAP